MHNKADEKLSVKRLAVPMINYALIAAQFIIAARPFSPEIEYFIPWNISEYSDNEKSAIYAIALSIPYAIFVILYLLTRDYFKKIFRWPGDQKLEQFRKLVIDISEYHNRNYVVILRDYCRGNASYARRSLNYSYSTIMLDIIVTDLRDAFENLFSTVGIRVAIHTKEEDSRFDQEVLKRRVITEFEGDRPDDHPFLVNPNTGKYEGFCGSAWNEMSPQCGTYRRNFFSKSDKRFRIGDVLDTKKSFLCIPICVKDKGYSSTIAVITIDSPNSRDFILSDNNMRKIDCILDPVRNVVFNYLYSV